MARFDIQSTLILKGYLTELLVCSAKRAFGQHVEEETFAPAWAVFPPLRDYCQRLVGY
jgi:hypothetical protein